MPLPGLATLVANILNNSLSGYFAQIIDSNGNTHTPIVGIFSPDGESSSVTISLIFADVSTDQYTAETLNVGWNSTTVLTESIGVEKLGSEVLYIQVDITISVSPSTFWFLISAIASALAGQVYSTSFSMDFGYTLIQYGEDTTTDTCTSSVSSTSNNTAGATAVASGSQVNIQATVSFSGCQQVELTSITISDGYGHSVTLLTSQDSSVCTYGGSCSVTLLSILYV